MRAPIRLLLLIAIPLTVLSMGILFAADESGPRGTALGHWLREMQRRDHLDSITPELIRSTERVQEILGELVEGRLTLPDAAEQLRAERDSRPTFFHVQPMLDEGESINEYFLRLTIQQVEWLLSDDARQSQVIERLQLEFRSYLAKSGHSVATGMDRGDGSREGSPFVTAD